MPLGESRCCDPRCKMLRSSLQRSSVLTPQAIYLSKGDVRRSLNNTDSSGQKGAAMQKTSRNNLSGIKPVPADGQRTYSENTQ